MIINRSVLSSRRESTRSLRDGSTILRRHYIDCDVNPTSLLFALRDLVNLIPVEGESNCIFYNVFVLFRINNGAQLSINS